MIDIKLKVYKYCLRCGRLLKSEEAKQIGMGKVCLEKSKKQTIAKPLFSKLN